MFRSVAKNFSILTGAQLANAAMVFLFFAFVARQFGPDLFGKYILINAYVRLVSLVINAGLAPIAFRELARHRDDAAELFADIVSMRLALAIAGYVVLITVLASLSEDRELLRLMAIAGLPLISDAFAHSYAAYYTAHERMSVPSAYAIASTALTVLAGVTLLLTGFGLFALIASSALVSIISATVWSAVFRARTLRFTIRVRFAAWRRLIMLVIPFAPIHVSNQLNRVLNVILLGHLRGPLPMEQSVGYYSPAQSVTNTVVMLVMGLRQVLIPPVTVKLSQGYTVTSEVDLAMKVVVAAFCLPLLLGTSFMAPELIALLFGNQYIPSAEALVVLGWAGALQIAAMVPESFLFSHPEHKVQEYIPGAVISVLVNAILCVLLIAEHGIIGAAAAAVGARTVYLAFATHYCRRQMRSKSLRLRHFVDTGLLLLAGFGVWHVATASIDNKWIAFAIAVALTLALIAAFMLYLRRRSIASQTA